MKCSCSIDWSRHTLYCLGICTQHWSDWLTVSRSTINIHTHGQLHRQQHMTAFVQQLTFFLLISCSTSNWQLVSCWTYVASINAERAQWWEWQRVRVGLHWTITTSDQQRQLVRNHDHVQAEMTQESRVRKTPAGTLLFASLSHSQSKMQCHLISSQHDKTHIISLCLAKQLHLVILLDIYTVHYIS